MIERSQINLSEVLSDPAHVRRALGERIERALAVGRNGQAVPRIVRVAVPVEGIDPFVWLQAQPGASKLYWGGREEEDVVAAAGIADLWEGDADADFSELRRLASVLGTADAAVRYYGGLRFDPEHPAEAAWAPFGAYRFVLPRFELHRRGAVGLLACSLFLPRDAARAGSILEEAEALRLPVHGLSGALPLPVARRDNPGEAGWRRNIRTALSAFGGTSLEKVVLARRATFEFPEALDPTLLLEHLAAATPGCFHFLFGTAQAAFVGASPERLFRREGRMIRSEAVAGTRPRGDSATDDARLRRELLRSEKDQREHAYVRQSIGAALHPLCDVLQVDEHASEMALARGRHLRSGVRGRLREGVTDLDVLRALHPTPAVGGYPTAEALETIRRLEAFDRGWYAGPVGWIGRAGSEFAVGIRSGLVKGRRLALYSGAGIVPGSTPEGEWDEIEHKISDFINVLGLDLRRAKY